MRPGYERARLLEQLVDAAEVRLALQHRHVEKHHRLAQMMIRAEGADCSRRAADYRRRLAAPHALAVRSRADIDRVLEAARDRAVVFRRDEQQRLRTVYALAERRPRCRRRIGFEILVIQRQVADLDNLACERCGCEFNHGFGDAAAISLLAQAADDDGDIGAHICSSRSETETWMAQLFEKVADRARRC